MILKDKAREFELNSFLEASKLMDHRGPDFTDHLRYRNCLLIHYRLSILDLDSRSNQPFISQNGNCVCTYNGEIYNYRDLKNKYGIQARTTSDTEVMLELFAKYGNTTVPEWNGIFATAILQKNENKLWLIRDRFGVKPLYYIDDPNYFAFASELKVLYKWLDSIEVDMQSVSEYMWYGNTVSENTMAKGVKKLAPAAILEFDLETGKTGTIEKYWKLPDPGGSAENEENPVKAIRELLGRAVERQLVSDVPLGVLLSGGIDSSAIVAFASSHIDNLDTYTVEYDFNIGGESELENAALVAKKFGTNHHEMKVRSDDITDIFSDLVYQYDDPFSDTANIPLYLLAKACSRDKKVILQGDGGDEFFGGYRRYNVLDWQIFWKVVSSLSYPFIPSRTWSLRMKRISYILKQNDAMKMALYLTEDVPYESPFSILNQNVKEKIESCDPFEAYKAFNLRYKDLEIVQRMLYADVHILLPHTYLEKVDKATMRCSLEARVPFLDNELTEYMLNLPSNYKIRNGQKKYLLRKALRGIVPDQILDGKKRGFNVPYKEWLKEGLFDFAYSTFDDIRDSELLDAKMLKEMLLKHKKNIGNFGPLLWKGLVLAHWIKIYRSKIQW